jgi:CCDC93, coiled-coil domain
MEPNQTGILMQVRQPASAHRLDRARFQFEEREDPEQRERMGDTMDLLVAAGYFRARIKTLPPFDKVTPPSESGTRGPPSPL